MNVLNEHVNHEDFGLGTITETNNDKITVQFQNDIGEKLFLYPEAFGFFLQAVDPIVQKHTLEELHRKQEQLRLEKEDREKELEAAKLEEENKKAELKKKKKPRKTTKKKS